MDKKVKRSVEMIKMPDDVKERIIAECEAADQITENTQIRSIRSSTLKVTISAGLSAV